MMNTLKMMKKAHHGFQMPASTGITANVMKEAYIGAGGSEVVLVWNSATGSA